MARRRPSRASLTNKIKKTLRPCIIEALEERLQFVVLHGGDVFEFYAQASIYERVVVEGANTTVELVGGRVNTMTGGFSLTTMDGVITAGPDAGVVGVGFTENLSNVPFDTIFAMDVVQSDANSSIAVAMVPPPTTPPPRYMEPYSGSNTLLVVPTAVSGLAQLQMVTGAGPVPIGGALLGAITQPPSPGLKDIPILSANVTGGEGFTYVQPGPLSAGLQVAGTMNEFLFGGTVMGNVVIHGSINIFYAGWLVTGNAQGEADVGVVSDPDNFTVDGDINNLITDASIGTNSDAALETPVYVSGFDMSVGGRVGQITTGDSLIGNVTVANSNPLSGFAAGTPYTEVENRGPANFDPWDDAELGAAPGEPAAFLNNDTFATAQYLGADSNGDVTVDGEIQADPATQEFVDYYAVPLIAGQTITVQLTEQPLTVDGLTEPALSGDLDVGVFDSDDRLVATDYNRVDPTQTQEEPFQYTATEPGVYRFAVAESINPNFVADPGNKELDDFPYALSIQGVGNLAIGGIVAANNIMDDANAAGAGEVATGNSSDNIDGFHVLTGDFGAAVAGGVVTSEFGDTADQIFTFAVDDGNLRAVEGASIGDFGSKPALKAEATGPIAVPGGFRTNITTAVNEGATVNFSPSVYAPAGSVGLLEATNLTGAAGVLFWNVFVLEDGESLTAAQSAQYAIGGDYEMVSAASTFGGDLIADGNIGTIRAGDMATDPASYLQVNAANNPAVHGTIDLIQAELAIGDLADGGPAIVTGQGGNVRYMDVGPYGVIYRDIIFGGGQPEVTEYQPGESVTLTDDSGTLVTLTPVGGAPAANFNPAQPVYTTPAELFVTTYPIRGSGGAAIVEVESSDSLDVSASGVGSGQTAEIGKIVLDGTGTTVTAGTTTTTTTTTTTGAAAGTPGGPPVKTNNGNGRYKTQTIPSAPTLPANALPLTLNYTGNVSIDTYDITGPPNASLDNSLAAGGGEVTSISNTTPNSETVNVQLTSLGTFTTSGSLGMALEHNTPAAVQGAIIDPNSEDTGSSGEPWLYPFLDPRSMVRVVQNIISITAAQGVGNVYAGIVNGAGLPTAPGDPNFDAPQPLFAGTPAVGATGTITGGTNGQIGSITGEILGPIVGAGSIESVNSPHGVGPNGSGAVGGDGLYGVSTIGNVVSGGDFLGTEVSTTGQVSLTVNGVIAGAEISNYSEFDFAEARAAGVEIPNTFPNPITFPTVDIGSINVTGNGGIIGTDIEADHIGTITIAPTGFGDFDSYISVLGEGTISGISMGGYGLRDGRINGGASFGGVVVHGNGSNSPVTNYPASVRQSETGAQFDAQTGAPLTFLNDIDLFLGTSAATPSITGVTDTGIIEDAEILGSRTLGSVTAYSIRGRVLPTNTAVAGFVTAISPDVSTFNVADAISNITVTGPINGFALTTGRTSKYSFGGDVSNMDMTVAGPINNLVLHSSFDDNSSINAIGPSGHIGSLTIDGDLAGSVTSTTYIQSLRILGSISGTVKAGRIGTINLSGAVGTGGLTIDGPLTNLIVNGNFGPTGDPITVNGNAGVIRVKGDLAASIDITGKLNLLIVNGSILTNSASHIGGILNLLQVAGDVQAGATLQAELIKRQRIKGQLLGTIIP